MPGPKRQLSAAEQVQESMKNRPQQNKFGSLGGGSGTVFGNSGNRGASAFGIGAMGSGLAAGAAGGSKAARQAQAANASEAALEKEL